MSYYLHQRFYVLHSADRFRHLIGRSKYFLNASRQKHVIQRIAVYRSEISCRKNGRGEIGVHEAFLFKLWCKRFTSQDLKKNDECSNAVQFDRNSFFQRVSCFNSFNSTLPKKWSGEMVMSVTRRILKRLTDGRRRSVCFLCVKSECVCLTNDDLCACF